jgi:hypothetical protein
MPRHAIGDRPMTAAERQKRMALARRAERERARAALERIRDAAPTLDEARRLAAEALQPQGRTP